MTRELVIIRSLAESDMGLFSAHRATLRGKQRAININAPAAKRLLSDRLFRHGGGLLECFVEFSGIENNEQRPLKKSGKNWRLGGAKLEDHAFGRLDCKDFCLIRSIAKNDGTAPIRISFVSRSDDPSGHAQLASLVEKSLVGSTAIFEQGSAEFDLLINRSSIRPAPGAQSAASRQLQFPPPPGPSRAPIGAIPRIPPHPSDRRKAGQRTMKEKIREPHFVELMLKMAGDLSAPAQVRFIETVEQLAFQLRHVLVETGGIVPIPRDHRTFWKSVAGQPIGFVDGGLANLSMLGSAPVAARVGGYIVTPGQRGDGRERFLVLKQLIDQLYANPEGGLYDDSFPDVGALRDAARISVEAAGAIRLVSENPDVACVMLHGALVNPVSRYTDVMQDGVIRYRFPDFSSAALADLLPPGTAEPIGRERNFIAVHLRQLQALQQAPAIVCGVVERESRTSTVCRAVLDSLDDHAIRDLLPAAPGSWKHWFRSAMDPSGSDEGMEGQRITDSLLFRCVLEPGEALNPVIINRNVLHKAPRAWQKLIERYPKPLVTYLQVSEWSSPVRIELFQKDAGRFSDTVSLAMHCSLLLPSYAFPVGLDIVDKFAHVPDWMSRPVNTRTAVLALREAMTRGDTRLFDTLRRMLCGSAREWLLRPGVFR